MSTPDLIAAQQRATDEAMMQLDQQGFRAIVDLVTFPLFGITNTDKCFLPRSPLFIGYASSPTLPRPGFSRVGVVYVTPDYTNVEESFFIECADSDEEQRSPVKTKEDYAVSAFSYLAAFGPPLLRQLQKGRMLSQYINAPLLRNAPVVSKSIHHRTGEDAEWEIRHIAAPISLLSARTRLQGTIIHIVAAGQQDREMDAILTQIVRFESGSSELEELARDLERNRPRFAHQ